MRIGSREIGPLSPPYIIAEIGVNHDGSVARALELTDAAARAGADAIKLQLFRTDLLLGREARLASYQASAGETDAIAMLRRLELRAVDMSPVVDLAHALGLHAIVTVFSVELVDLARAQAWDAFKSASPDIVHRPLLEAMAADGRPLIVSTGASDLWEVERAIRWLGPARERIALLQCVSSYPAPTPALEGIGALRSALGGVVGYSDHAPGVDSASSAVRAGAMILEKHLTHRRSAPGPDHVASLEPAQFGAYVQLALEAWTPAEQGAPAPEPAPGPAPGHAAGAAKAALACEQDVRRLSRQSITAARELEAGRALQREDVTFKRPGTGLAPWQLEEVIGRRLRRPVGADLPLRAEDFEPAPP